MSSDGIVKSSGAKWNKWFKKTSHKTPGNVKQINKTNKANRINRIKGAQFPPITTNDNPYTFGKSKHKKSKSITLTLKSAENNKNYGNSTVYPPFRGGNKNENNKPNNSPLPDMDVINFDSVPDIHELIQSVKEERERNLKNENGKSKNKQKENENDEENDNKNDQIDFKNMQIITTKHNNKKENQNDCDSPASPHQFQSIEPSSIKEWDEMKNESDVFARKNRNRINLLTKLLSAHILDDSKLRLACWRGVPHDMRPAIWKLLLGYTPKNLSRRASTLNKKRLEYYDLMERYYNQTSREHRSDQENKIVHQIGLDVPRTSPELQLFQISKIKNLLSRALYIWSLRHTATGYVQGINDLITPFVYIFLDDLLRSKYNGHMSLSNMKSRDMIDSLSDNALLAIEADSYWCLDYLIEGLQLNYTDNQPGIYNMVSQLEDVCKRVNIALFNHFGSLKLEFIQFSFRWMNCLLMRELSLSNIIRLWDTYLCEGVELANGFSEFHVFVCAALLLSFADELMQKDFAEIMLFLQGLPSVTAKWGERQISTILSEAYVYQQLFGKSKNANIQRY